MIIRKGTIANVLRRRKDELFAFMQARNQINQLHQKVLEILSDPELTNNSAVPEARAIFEKSKNNYNKYLSVLTTYMTGEKVV